jgi:predicted transcriptional regulator
LSHAREHFIKGKTIREIARDLKVSRNTVRKVLRSEETTFEYERNVQPRPKLVRWTAELEGLLSGNAAKPARERLTLDPDLRRPTRAPLRGRLRCRASLRQGRLAKQHGK